MPIPEPQTPEFQSLLDQLSEADKTQLEAYIRQKFGDSGGTIAGELQAGRMTPAEAVALLMKSGYSPQQAQYLVQNGLLNIPLLTNEGDIAAQMGPRGGMRALEGPTTLQKSLVGQEVARQFADWRSRAWAAVRHPSGRGGGVWGGGGGGEGPPEPPQRPPLPPIPIPGQPPWWQAAVAPLAGIAGKGLFDLLGRSQGKSGAGNPTGNYPTNENPYTVDFSGKMATPGISWKTPPWAQSQSQMPMPSNQTDYGNWASADWSQPPSNTAPYDYNPDSQSGWESGGSPSYNWAPEDYWAEVNPSDQSPAYDYPQFDQTGWGEY